MGLATVRDETELIGKGFDLLGKVLEKKPEEGKAPEEEAEPNQAVEIEHDHQDHFGWYHEHMIPLWAAAITTIGLIAVALLKGRPARRRARRQTRK